MAIAYVGLGVLSLPAMLVLTNLFFRGMREARGVALLLADRDMLQQIVTKSVLSNPPSEILRFARTPYAVSLTAFQESDRAAHATARGVLRIATALVLIGSGVVGFLGLGWFGMAFPAINLFIMQTTFVGSTEGVPERAAMDRSVEHVQVLSVILHRWLASDERGASTWLNERPQFATLADVLRRQ